MNVSETGNILIVRPDRVGDVIVSTSCLPLLKKNYPKAKLFFMARKGMEPLFKDHSLIEEFLSLPSAAQDGNRFLKTVQNVRDQLISLQFKAVFFLQPDPVAYMAAWWAKIPQRIGYSQRYWTWTLTQALSYDKNQGLKHEAEYCLDVLRFEKGNEKLKASISLSDKERSASFPPEPYAAFHLAAFSPILRWPAERFAEVAVFCHQAFGLKPILIGSDSQDKANHVFTEKVRKSAKVEVLDYCGKTNLRELAELLKEASILVTRNSGPAHLASAVGCPVVELFGRLEPIYGVKRWKALGEKTRVVLPDPLPVKNRFETKKKFWARSYLSISTAQVKKEVSELLQSEGKNNDRE